MDFISHICNFVSKKLKKYSIMMGGITIEIDGWEPNRKYFGGDTIHGNVHILNKSPTNKVLEQDLVIKFCGKAESHWKEQRKNVGHYRQYLVTTTDTETYFDEIVTLQHRDSSDNKLQIPPGQNSYPFTFQFPPGIPQSFKSDHGKVWYVAEVPFPKPWDPGHVTQLELEVVAHLDLNILPQELTGPGRFNMTKSFWWGLGRVEAQLYLPTRVFVPMEDINFTLEVINHSGCYLKKIRVYFCQVTTYRAKDSDFKEGARLSKIKCKPVHPRGTATIEGSISVPEVPPTELGGCELIQPQYGIMIKVIATTLGKMVKSAVLEGRVPIIIGTVPLGKSIGLPPSSATMIRPITALRQSIEFSQRRLVLTPEEEEKQQQKQQDTDRFTNLAAEIESSE